MDDPGAQTGDRGGRWVEFELTPDDLVRVFTLWIYTDESSSTIAQAVRTARRNAAFIGVLAGVACYGLFSMLHDVRGRGARSTEEILAFGLISLVIAVGTFALAGPKRVFRKRLAAMTAKHRADAIGPGQVGRVRITIDDDAAVYEDQVVCASHPWPVFRDISRVEGYSLMTTFGERVFIIPDRVFDSGAQREAFVEGCRARNEAAGGGGTMVSAFLADRDLACAGCGYQLRGVRGAECPECGRAIEPPAYAALVSPKLLKKITKTGRP